MDDGSALWGYASSGESRWPSAAAIFVALLLQLALPDRVTPGPRYVIPALEFVLLAALMLANPSQLTEESKDVRILAVGLVALVTGANMTSLVLLVQRLVHGSVSNGRALIVAGAGVWLTNVIVFGLWYWEMDRGGPLARRTEEHAPPDFLFPQMENPGTTRGRWSPSFIDYLYVSLTNAAAFSPTDTMPLTTRAKALMGVEGLASLATIGIVAARAVNILR
jgi:uncharacterized membrane protein